MRTVLSPTPLFALSPGTTHSAGQRDRPRILYCTGRLSPGSEGVSREVFALREGFPHAWILGLSRFYGLRCSFRERYLGLNLKLYPVLRLLAPLWERLTDLHHIYGSVAEWFFLRTLRRRPIVMTVAVEAPPLDASLYEHVSRFVVHSQRTVTALTAAGLDPHRIQVVPPGIDLGRFTPLPARPMRTSSSAFRLLFATAPPEADALADRGVALLLEVAARLPDVDIHLLWRPWPGADVIVERLKRAHPLPNLRISLETALDMAPVYAAHHATVAPFRTSAGMKVCPTSIAESLAVGRPVLVSSAVGIADLVEGEACGVVAEPTIEGICRGIDALRNRYETYRARARPAAERHFDLERCTRVYAKIYADILGGPKWRGGPCR